MNSQTSKLTGRLTGCITLVAGLVLWGSMAWKLNKDGKFSYEPNVACIKGSPYGKILALAMQGSIDFYWHKGKTHEDEAILAAGGDPHEGCEEGCDHEHHAVEKDHSAHQHPDDCGCEAHADPKKMVAGSDQPLRLRAKMRIKRMAAAVHRKTDGKPLTEAHERYLQGVTEDKLRFAYELDPSNYTNYGNYHLFVASTTYGLSEGDDDAAVALAQRTLDFCKKDQVDPASWVTAASAAYNIVFHIGRYHQNYTVAEAKASLAEFDDCVRTHFTLRRKAMDENRSIPEARLLEMEERIRYLVSLRKAQGIYMKRIMSTRMPH